MLAQQAPALLRGRSVTLHATDRDDEGAAFAKRALASLGADGAPFAHLDVCFEHSTCDWNRATDLAELIGRRGTPGAA